MATASFAHWAIRMALGALIINFFLVGPRTQVSGFEFGAFHVALLAMWIVSLPLTILPNALIYIHSPNSIFAMEMMTSALWGCVIGGWLAQRVSRRECTASEVSKHEVKSN